MTLRRERQSKVDKKADFTCVISTCLPEGATMCLTRPRELQKHTFQNVQNYFSENKLDVVKQKKIETKMSYEKEVGSSKSKNIIRIKQCIS